MFRTIIDNLWTTYHGKLVGFGWDQAVTPDGTSYYRCCLRLTTKFKSVYPKSSPEFVKYIDSVISC